MNKIKEIREKQFRTQNELATLARLTVSTISNVETGKTEPEFETLRKIAKALGVDINEVWSKE